MVVKRSIENKMSESKLTKAQEERIAIIRDLKERLEKIQTSLEKFETQRSEKVLAWKKKTNELIIS